MLPTREPAENSFGGGKLRFSTSTDSIDEEDDTSASYLDDGDGIDLDERSTWELRRLHRCTRGRVMHEPLTVDRIHGREVVHAGQEDRGLHDAAKRGPGRCQHGAQIAEHLTGLRLDVAVDHGAGGRIERDLAAAK